MLTESELTMNIIETISVPCPYCGEIMDIQVASSEGEQEYTEDCPICCKPIAISITLSESGFPSVDARPEDS